MKRTRNRISEVIETMKKFGMFDNITQNQKEIILQNLKDIAGSAVNEANNELQNILPNLYKEITQ